MRNDRYAPRGNTIEIELDSLTAERLERLARACGEADPMTIAASLLHDILRDDEETNCLGRPADPRLLN